MRQWWRTRGKRTYPGARKILIEADVGGSNGYRRRLWKRELLRWANADSLEITVSHYPTGASKCNPVEHRLFGPISTNWAGQPLRTLHTLLGFIRGTRATLTSLDYSPHQFHGLNVSTLWALLDL